jgi:hypothetical protein
MRKREFSRALGTVLIRLDYPKFIWVTEVSSSDLLNQPLKNDRRCVGRVITDATAPAKTSGVMVIHIADWVKLRDRQSGNENAWRVYPKSTPFQHKIH